MKTEKIDIGLKQPFTYRPQSSDREILDNVLLNRTEYILPDCKPTIIFDIGAHIGAAALLFTLAYPNATIYSFEPVKENFDLLCENTRAYKNIKTYNIALGARTRQRKFFASDNPLNTGGGSITQVGVDTSTSTDICVVGISGFMENISLYRIDLMKIDTEGAEYEILFRLYLDGKLPAHIVGEAHGVDDFKMFDMLSQSHELGLNKHFGKRCYPFYAARKEVHV